MFSKLHQIHTRWLAPRSSDPDVKRREYVFNVMIALLIAAALITLVSSGLTHLFGLAHGHYNSVINTTIFLLFALGLSWLSRRGRYVVGAYLVLGLLTLAAFQLMLQWSFELPMAQLLLILVIVVSGVVLSAKAAVRFTLAIAVVILVVGYCQVQGVFHPSVSWLDKPIELSDAVGMAVVFGMAGSLMWLSNRQFDDLLRRAHRSERALAKERDSLEIKVEARTRELERAQLIRTMELQRFAELGRVSASLFHDLVNPLTAVSMSLEQVKDQTRNETVEQAAKSFSQIERYVVAARKQLQGKSQPQWFNVADELAQVVDILRHRVQTAETQLEVAAPQDLQLFGDPVKFSQTILNLVVNAIEATEMVKKPRRPVRVEVAEHNKEVTIRVTDFGVGIPKSRLATIFRPFVSDKLDTDRGMGLGLSIVRQFVEQDFRGSIHAESSKAEGTTFLMTLPVGEYPHGTSRLGSTRTSSHRKESGGGR